MYVQIEYKKQRYDFWGVKFVIFEGGHLNLTLYNFFEGILFFKFPKGTKIINAFSSDVSAESNSKVITKFADEKYLCNY